MCCRSTTPQCSCTSWPVSSRCLRYPNAVPCQCHSTAYTQVAQRLRPNTLQINHSAQSRLRWCTSVAPLFKFLWTFMMVHSRVSFPVSTGYFLQASEKIFAFEASQAFVPVLRLAEHMIGQPSPTRACHMLHYWQYPPYLPTRQVGRQPPPFLWTPLCFYRPSYLYRIVTVFFEDPSSFESSL